MKQPFQGASRAHALMRRLNAAVSQADRPAAVPAIGSLLNQDRVIARLAGAGNSDASLERILKRLDRSDKETAGEESWPSVRRIPDTMSHPPGLRMPVPMQAAPVGAAEPSVDRKSVAPHAPLALPQLPVRGSSRDISAADAASLLSRRLKAKDLLTAFRTQVAAAPASAAIASQQTGNPNGVIEAPSSRRPFAPQAGQPGAGLRTPRLGALEPPPTPSRPGEHETAKQHAPAPSIVTARPAPAHAAQRSARQLGERPLGEPPLHDSQPGASEAATMRASAYSIASALWELSQPERPNARQTPASPLTPGGRPSTAPPRQVVAPLSRGSAREITESLLASTAPHRPVSSPHLGPSGLRRLAELAAERLPGDAADQSPPDGSSPPHESALPLAAAAQRTLSSTSLEQEFLSILRREALRHGIDPSGWTS